MGTMRQRRDRADRGFHRDQTRMDWYHGVSSLYIVRIDVY